MPSVIPVSLRYYTDRLFTKEEECARLSGGVNAREKQQPKAAQIRRPGLKHGNRDFLQDIATTKSLFRTRNASGSWNAGKMDSGMHRKGSTEHSPSFTHVTGRPSLPTL